MGMDFVSGSIFVPNSAMGIALVIINQLLNFTSNAKFPASCGFKPNFGNHSLIRPKKRQYGQRNAPERLCQFCQAACGGEDISIYGFFTASGDFRIFAERSMTSCLVRIFLMRSRKSLGILTSSV